MKKSVIHTDNGTYRITITPSTVREKVFLEKPLSEIKQEVYHFFDQAIKEELDEKASISSIVDDSGLPYEIQAYVTMDKNNTK